MDALPNVGTLFTGDRTENVLMVGDFRTNYMARFFHVIGWDRHSQLTQETSKDLAFTLSRDHADLKLYKLDRSDPPVLMDKIPCSVVKKTGVLQKIFLQHADAEYQFGMARIARACGITVDSDILTEDASNKEMDDIYDFFEGKVNEFYSQRTELEDFCTDRFGTGSTGGGVPEHKERGYQNMKAYLKFNGSGKNAKLIQTELHRSKLPEIPVLEQLLQENIDLENDILESENDNKTLRQQNSDLSEDIDNAYNDIFGKFEAMLNNNSLDSETTTPDIEAGMKRYWTLVKNKYQSALQAQKQRQTDAVKAAQEECGRMKLELDKLKVDFKQLQTAIVNGESPDEEPELNLKKMLEEIQKMRANNDSRQALPDDDKTRPAASTQTNDTPPEYNALKTKLDTLKNAVMKTTSPELKDDEDLKEYLKKIKNLYDDSEKWQGACNVKAGEYYRNSVENLMERITMPEPVKNAINAQKTDNIKLVETAIKWNNIKKTEGIKLSEYLRRLNAEMFDSKNAKLQEWSAQSETDSTGRFMKLVNQLAGLSNPTDAVLLELYEKWQQSYTAIESYKKMTENREETKNLPWSDFEREISEIQIKIPLLTLAISEVKRLTSENARLEVLEQNYSDLASEYTQLTTTLEKLASLENDKLLQAIDEYLKSDDAKSVSDALKITLTQLNEKLQKFKDDGVEPAPVADPDLLKYKKVVEELATGGQTMSEYLQTRLQETNLNPEELHENLVRIKNKLDILKKQQIVPAPPEEPDSSKYKEVIEKLADRNNTNMSGYLETRLQEENLQPASFKTSLENILQKLNDLTKQPPAPAPNTEPASPDNLASEPHNVNFDEVMSDINEANDSERKLALIRLLLESEETKMPPALKITFNDLLRIIDDACNVKDDARGLNEAHIMLQAVQQMIEMWESDVDVADPESNQDKLKRRLATVLKAFLDYMKKGKQPKGPNKAKVPGSTVPVDPSGPADSNGPAAPNDPAEPNPTPNPKRQQKPKSKTSTPQNDDAVRFMFVLLNLYQDHAKIKKGQKETSQTWPKTKPWPIQINKIKSFIQKCENNLLNGSSDEIIALEKLADLGLYGANAKIAVSFGTLFTKDVYFANINAETITHIPSLCKNFTDWLTQNFSTRTNEAEEGGDISQKIKEIYQIYNTWLTGDQEDLPEKPKMSIKGQDTDTEQDKFCKRVAFTYFCKEAIDKPDAFYLNEKRDEILCEIAKSLSNRTTEQWKVQKGEDENEVNNKIRSWWTPIPNKPAGGVTPNESPDLILDSSDGEESTSSDKSDSEDGDSTDMEEPTPHKLQISQIDGFINEIEKLDAFDNTEVGKLVDDYFQFENLSTDIDIKFFHETLFKGLQAKLNENQDLIDRQDNSGNGMEVVSSTVPNTVQSEVIRDIANNAVTKLMDALPPINFRRGQTMAPPPELIDREPVQSNTTIHEFASKQLEFLQQNLPAIETKPETIKYPEWKSCIMVCLQKFLEERAKQKATLHARDDIFFEPPSEPVSRQSSFASATSDLDSEVRDGPDDKVSSIEIRNFVTSLLKPGYKKTSFLVSIFDYSKLNETSIQQHISAMNDLKNLQDEKIMTELGEKIGAELQKLLPTQMKVTKVLQPLELRLGYIIDFHFTIETLTELRNRIEVCMKIIDNCLTFYYSDQKDRQKLYEQFQTYLMEQRQKLNFRKQMANEIANLMRVQLDTRNITYLVAQTMDDYKTKIEKNPMETKYIDRVKLQEWLTTNCLFTVDPENIQQFLEQLCENLANQICSEDDNQPLFVQEYKTLLQNFYATEIYTSMPKPQWNSFDQWFELVHQALQKFIEEYRRYHLTTTNIEWFKNDILNDETLSNMNSDMIEKLCDKYFDFDDMNHQFNMQEFVVDFINMICKEGFKDEDVRQIQRDQIFDFFFNKLQVRTAIGTMYTYSKFRSFIVRHALLIVEKIKKDKKDVQDAIDDANAQNYIDANTQEERDAALIRGSEDDGNPANTPTADINEPPADDSALPPVDGARNTAKEHMNVNDNVFAQIEAGNLLALFCLRTLQWQFKKGDTSLDSTDNDHMIVYNPETPQETVKKITTALKKEYRWRAKINKDEHTDVNLVDEKCKKLDEYVQECYTENKQINIDKVQSIIGNMTDTNLHSYCCGAYLGIYVELDGTRVEKEGTVLDFGIELSSYDCVRKILHSDKITKDQLTIPWTNSNDEIARHSLLAQAIIAHDKDMYDMIAQKISRHPHIYHDDIMLEFDSRLEDGKFAVLQTEYNFFWGHYQELHTQIETDISEHGNDELQTPQRKVVYLPFDKYLFLQAFWSYIIKTESFKDCVQDGNIRAAPVCLRMDTNKPAPEPDKTDAIEPLTKDFYFGNVSTDISVHKIFHGEALMQAATNINFWDKLANNQNKDQIKASWSSNVVMKQNTLYSLGYSENAIHLAVQFYEDMWHHKRDGRNGPDAQLDKNEILSVLFNILGLHDVNKETSNQTKLHIAQQNANVYQLLYNKMLELGNVEDGHIAQIVQNNMQVLYVVLKNSPSSTWLPTYLSCNAMKKDLGGPNSPTEVVVTFLNKKTNLNGALSDETMSNFLKSSVQSDSHVGEYPVAKLVSDFCCNGKLEFYHKIKTSGQGQEIDTCAFKLCFEQNELQAAYNFLNGVQDISDEEDDDISPEAENIDNQAENQRAAVEQSFHLKTWCELLTDSCSKQENATTLLLNMLELLRCIFTAQTFTITTESKTSSLNEILHSWLYTMCDDISHQAYDVKQQTEIPRLQFSQRTPGWKSIDSKIEELAADIESRENLNMRNSSLFDPVVWSTSYAHLLPPDQSSDALFLKRYWPSLGGRLDAPREQEEHIIAEINQSEFGEVDDATTQNWQAVIGQFTKKFNPWRPKFSLPGLMKAFQTDTFEPLWDLSLLDLQQGTTIQHKILFFARALTYQNAFDLFSTKLQQNVFDDCCNLIGLPRTLFLCMELKLSIPNKREFQKQQNSGQYTYDQNLTNGTEHMCMFLRHCNHAKNQLCFTEDDRTCENLANALKLLQKNLAHRQLFCDLKQLLRLDHTRLHEKDRFRKTISAYLARMFMPLDFGTDETIITCEISNECAKTKENEKCYYYYLDAKCAEYLAKIVLIFVNNTYYKISQKNPVHQAQNDNLFINFVTDPKGFGKNPLPLYNEMLKCLETINTKRSKQEEKNLVMMFYSLFCVDYEVKKIEDNKIEAKLPLESDTRKDLLVMFEFESIDIYQQLFQIFMCKDSSILEIKTTVDTMYDVFILDKTLVALKQDVSFQQKLRQSEPIADPIPTIVPTPVSTPVEKGQEIWVKVEKHPEGTMWVKRKVTNVDQNSFRVHIKPKGAPAIYFFENKNPTFAFELTQADKEELEAMKQKVKIGDIIKTKIAINQYSTFEKAKVTALSFNDQDIQKREQFMVRAWDGNEMKGNEKTRYLFEENMTGKHVPSWSIINEHSEKATEDFAVASMNNVIDAAADVNDGTLPSPMNTTPQYYMLDGTVYMTTEPAVGLAAADRPLSFVPSYTNNYHYMGGYMW